MAQIKLGQSGQQKATNAGVKNFAAMLVDAHSAANEQIKNWLVREILHSR